MNRDRPLVLVVDDYQDTCELYQFALPHEGFAVVSPRPWSRRSSA
jgi:CheY-like chemotaxis protein